MKRLELKKLENIIGGSAETRLCYFSTAIWFGLEATGSPAYIGMGRGLINFCWSN